MQTVSTTTCHRVINGKVQIIAPKEPLESPSSFLPPTLVSRDPGRFEAGGYHGLRLHRLLIEPRTLTAPLIKTVGSHGNKMTPTLFSAPQLRPPHYPLQPSLGH